MHLFEGDRLHVRRRVYWSVLEGVLEEDVVDAYLYLCFLPDWTLI